MSNINKVIFSLILLPLAEAIAFTNSAGAETLRTEHFQIKINRRCAEGNVSCDRVTYVGRDLRTGKSIRLNGRTVNSARSYSFKGYEFQNGDYRYFVGSDNALLIYKGGRLILSEQGTSIGD